LAKKDDAYLDEIVALVALQGERAFAASLRPLFIWMNVVKHFLAVGGLLGGRVAIVRRRGIDLGH